MSILSAIIVSAWIAWLLVQLIDGPARERRRGAERQAMLDAIEACPDAQPHQIEDGIKARLGYGIGISVIFGRLALLERDGAIVSRWGPPARLHGPRPRLYRLAPQPHQALPTL